MKCSSPCQRGKQVKSLLHLKPCLTLLKSYNYFIRIYLVQSIHQAYMVNSIHSRGSRWLLSLYWGYFCFPKEWDIDILPKLLKKLLRSDKGTKFLKDKISYFCNEFGILHDTSTTRTPQQNSIAERWNKIFKEVGRTLTEESSIPKKYWAEVVNKACYVQNRSLLIKRQGKTPYEL